MFETILVPLDGSDLAEEAIDPAGELARCFGSRIVLVQAVDSLAMRMSQPPAIIEAPAAAAASVDVFQSALEAEKEGAHRYLAEVRDRLAAGGGRVEAFVGEGPATDVILSVAREQGAGVIVMSTHGRGGLGRLVFGSVADGILRRSETPVLLIRSRERPKT
ncbi:MAG TPA: universal stress protein [Dehalococcoidia bacterium]|nr:universal stress protein [Dehalococcoidia bacterium]